MIILPIPKPTNRRHSGHFFHFINFGHQETLLSMRQHLWILVRVRRPAIDRLSFSDPNPYFVTELDVTVMGALGVNWFLHFGRLCFGRFLFDVSSELWRIAWVWGFFIHEIGLVWVVEWDDLAELGKGRWDFLCGGYFARCVLVILDLLMLFFFLFPVLNDLIWFARSYGCFLFIPILSTLYNIDFLNLILIFLLCLSSYNRISIRKSHRLSYFRNIRLLRI